MYIQIILYLILDFFLFLFFDLKGSFSVDSAQVLGPAHVHVLYKSEAVPAALITVPSSSAAAADHELNLHPLPLLESSP